MVNISFRSEVKCNRNSEYNLCNGSELGSFSLTVLVISVIAFCPIAHRNMSFISASNSSWYCGSISLLFVIVDRSRSFVILVYCTNFRHHMFALVQSCFSSVGMVSFCVQVCSTVLFIVSLGGGCSPGCDPVIIMFLSPFLVGLFVLSSTVSDFR